MIHIYHVLYLACTCGNIRLTILLMLGHIPLEHCMLQIKVGHISKKLCWYLQLQMSMSHGYVYCSLKLHNDLSFDIQLLAIMTTQLSPANSHVRVDFP